ncbi:MAG TPA: DedA family protein [Vicinamibacterales bacterium]|jgi:membrane protein DedA with SNARE-associated domain|nr:DedA family protein [Vicinamibacterales bacterium]
MAQTLVDSLAAHGSLALFGLLVLGVAGLPVPDETLLIIAGMLIDQSRLHAGPTYAAAMFGSAVGITISYLIGRAAGIIVIQRHGHRLRVPTDSIEDVRAVFRRAGKWSLTFGYFVPGLRHLTALVAGAANLEFGLFAAFAYSGAIVWSITFITLGVYLGDRWETAAREIEIHGRIAGIVVLLMGAAALAWITRRKGPTRRGS